MPMEEDEKEGVVPMNGVERDNDEENENSKMSVEEGSEEEGREEDNDQNMEDRLADDTTQPNLVQEVHKYQVKFEGKKLGLKVAKGKGKGNERIVWVTEVVD